MTLRQSFLRWFFGWLTPQPPAPSPSAPGDLLSLVNQERQQRGLQSYRANTALTLAAQQHADWMLRHGSLTHAGDGSMASRITSAGYQWSVIAENIASGQTTPSEVIASWMGSAGHRANLLGNFRDAGFGRAGNWWCADFASPVAF